ncbi:MAG: nitrate reductase cytochrome c-type subunit [Myxococcales bacterium]|nr:nitrate reductase cytochrome c-type subunit [Myxococcales bacterium]
MNLPGVKTGPRATLIGVALSLGAAAVVLVYWTRGVPEPAGYHAAAPRDGAGFEVQPAPTYGQLRDRAYGADLDRHATAFAAMGHQRPELTAEVVRSAEALAAARTARAEHRAFAGAPPVIPHAIDQRDYPNCMSCHADGLVVGERVAPAMSHAPYASCVQCHAPAGAPPPVAATAPAVAGNTFEGLAEPSGERAAPGAPPTVPHSTLMRERCNSCHGVLGQGIVTTHPWRTSCLQCHGPSAALDQRDSFSQLSPPPVAP